MKPLFNRFLEVKKSISENEILFIQYEDEIASAMREANTRKTQENAEAITAKQHYFFMLLSKRFATRFVKGKK